MLYYILFLKVCYGIFILCFVFFILLDCYYVLRNNVINIFIRLIIDNKNIVILCTGAINHVKEVTKQTKTLNLMVQNKSYFTNIPSFNRQLDSLFSNIHQINKSDFFFNITKTDLTNKLNIEFIENKIYLAKELYSFVKNIQKSSNYLELYYNTLKNRTEIIDIVIDNLSTVYKIKLDLETITNEYFISQNSLLSIRSLYMNKVKDADSLIQKHEISQMDVHTNLCLSTKNHTIASTFTTKDKVCLPTIYDNILFKHYFKNSFIYRNEYLKVDQYLSNIHTTLSLELYDNCTFKEKKICSVNREITRENLSNVLDEFYPLFKDINSFLKVSFSINNGLMKKKCTEIEELLVLSNEESMKQSYLETDSICKDSQKISESMDNLIICLSNTLNN